jgi:hypothetical protein
MDSNGWELYHWAIYTQFWRNFISTFQHYVIYGVFNIIHKLIGIHKIFQFDILKWKVNTSITFVENYNYKYVKLASKSFFPRELLHANEYLNEFFCNLFKIVFKFSPTHQFFFVTHDWINMIFKKCANSL